MIIFLFIFLAYDENILLFLLIIIRIVTHNFIIHLISLNVLKVLILVLQVYFLLRFICPRHFHAFLLFFLEILLFKLLNYLLFEDHPEVDLLTYLTDFHVRQLLTIWTLHELLALLVIKLLIFLALKTHLHLLVPAPLIFVILLISFYFPPIEFSLTFLLLNFC